MALEGGISCMWGGFEKSRLKKIKMGLLVASSSVP